MLLWAVAALAGPSASPKPSRRMRPPAPEPAGEDPSDLAARDPVEALLRYGTADTAQNLRETGRGDDLHGLGYRKSSPRT
jgi:hypothetical protein